ncbi:MAG: [Fe-Fe] hydrogenase large subunit C-terminal domain-containing protein [Clostridia bacterium]
MEVPGEFQAALPPAAIRNPQIVFTLLPNACRALTARVGLEANAHGHEVLCAMLRKLGAHEVLTSGCDGSALAEARELVQRLRQNALLPQLMLTCPRWARTVESEHPEFSAHFSSASRQCAARWNGAPSLAPGQAEAAKRDLPPMTHMLVVNCPAQRKALRAAALPGERLLTVRELALWLAREGICIPRALRREAATPCCSQLLAVLRYALQCTQSSTPEAPALQTFPLPGIPFAHEVRVFIEGKEIRAATVRGVDSAYLLMERIKAGGKPYALIEVLACV